MTKATILVLLKSLKGGMQQSKKNIKIHFNHWGNPWCCSHYPLPLDGCSASDKFSSTVEETHLAEWWAIFSPFILLHFQSSDWGTGQQSASSDLMVQSQTGLYLLLTEDVCMCVCSEDWRRPLSFTAPACEPLERKMIFWMCFTTDGRTHQQRMEEK